VKCYELHYQQKNVETPDGKRIMQYRCLNFLAPRDSSLKFSIAIKNKWSARRMKSWFYCCVSCRRSSRGVKSMYALRSRMSEFDYVVEPEVECPDDDLNDATFVRATTTIGAAMLPCHYLLWDPLPLNTPIIFWQEWRWRLRGCWGPSGQENTMPLEC
jgi:hypothetical protein